MPHIKTKPFHTSKLGELAEKEDFVTFHAFLRRPGMNGSSEELVGVEIEGESFVLELHKREEEFLIKAEKSTRPPDANKIKRALGLLAENAGAEIIHDNITVSPARPPLADRYSKHPEDFESVDFGGRKVALEIGFGSGRHLIHQAKANPDVLYIGIEIHTPSAEQVLRQIQLQQIENIQVVSYDARLIVEMLPSNSVEEIYLHFPVPWDKKPLRRVISRHFVSEVLRILRKGGFLELRTDSQNYFDYAVALFKDFDNTYFEVRKNNEIAVSSKYEDRWRRLEKEIYTIILYSTEHSKETKKDFDFSFSGTPKDTRSLLELSQQAIVEDTHFVHFGKKYEFFNSDGVLIKCSFGNFGHPEQKLIIVRRDRVYYYPFPPVKSIANNSAHQTIREHIYV